MPLAQLEFSEHGVKKLQPCAQRVDPTLALDAIRERVECGASEILLDRSEAVVGSDGGRDRRLGPNGGRQSRASQALQAGGDDVRGCGAVPIGGRQIVDSGCRGRRRSGRTRRSATAALCRRASRLANSSAKSATGSGVSPDAGRCTVVRYGTPYASSAPATRSRPLFRGSVRRPSVASVITRWSRQRRIALLTRNQPYCVSRVGCACLT